MHWVCSVTFQSEEEASPDPEGGDRGSGPPPWHLSEVGSCVEVWWVGEGVQRLCLPYYCNFFLAHFARQYYTNIYTYFQVQCSVLNGHPFSNIYLNYEKNPTSHLLLLWKGIFIFFSSRITRFYTIQSENFLGRTPRPPPPFFTLHSYYQSKHWRCLERIAKRKWIQRVLTP